MLDKLITFPSRRKNIISRQNVAPPRPLQPCHATRPRVCIAASLKNMRKLTNELRFNSYTQQICIDDAVVIDEQRPENVVTNDGTTMRIMAQKNALPSAWTRQKEVIVGKPATAILVENAKKAKAEVKLIEEELADEEAAAGTSPCHEIEPRMLGHLPIF
jgi:hypothetical protein